MKRVFHFILPACLLSLGLALTTGCAFTKPTDKEADADAVQPQILTERDILASEELISEVIETENLNEYFVQYSWPTGKNLRIEVSVGDQVYTNKSDQIRFQIPIDAGSIQKFAVTVYNSLGGVVFNRVDILEAPKDFSVSDILNLDKDSDWTFNKIRIEKNARIYLNGYNLIIKSNSLYSDVDAQVFTAHQSIFAPTKNTLKGSQVNIHTKKANGFFLIHMNGYNGRDGRSGDELDRELNFIDTYLPTLKGKDGIAGESQEQCKLSGGGSPRGDGPGIDICSTVCKRQPTNGSPGLRGAPGRDGEDGWDGGSPGQLSVTVDDPESRLNIEVIMRPGQPGKPGAGGIGRLGGKGGFPGQASKKCSPASPGADGPRGPRGKTGKEGQAAASGIATDPTKKGNVNFYIR